jgi:ABC-type polysaccharide/polyol phosphate export permease
MVNQAVYLSHGFAEYVGEIVRSRRLILDLTKREFRSRFLGSAFGLIWAFIHPAVLMFIYWVVFGFFLNGGPINGVPFVVWLLAGLVPWFFAADCIATGGNVIIENRFLVKKVVFRVSLLPVVRLFSLLPVHLFFLVVITLICWGYGYPPSWYTLQLVYYLFALGALALGMSWLISALVPFLKDLAQVVAVLLQIIFWMTPIVWQVQRIPADYRWILFLNPLYYIIQGYRDSLVEHVWFWEHPMAAAYYWAVTAFFVSVGGLVFLRMQSHFADVL